MAVLKTTMCKERRNVFQLLILYLITIFISCRHVERQSPCDVHRTIANCASRSLTHVPQNLPRNIETLFLSGNNLTQIKAYSFRNYINLTFLDLSNSKVRKLENYSFSGLPVLQALNLEANDLNLTYAAYPARCFAGLTALKQLFLGGNVPMDFLLIPQPKFSYPDDSLSQLPSLEALSIDGLPETVFGPGFRALTELKTLFFEECYLNYIHEDMFVNTPYITQLNMSGCNIYDSHNTSLAKLPDIDTLDISYNFDLGFNNATHISFGLQNSSVRVLNMSQIVPLYAACVIPPVDFLKHLNNTYLEELIFDLNKIQLLKPGTLDYFPLSLIYLSVRYNLFLFSQYIFELPKILRLKRLDISESLISHHSLQPSSSGTPTFPQPWQRLPFPPQLEEITLRNIIIHAVIPPVIFMTNNLRSADLSQNGVSIWIGPVTGLHKLERADLSKNYCSSVTIDFFDRFPLLNFLNISNNYLGDAIVNHPSRGLFDNLTKLEVLDMSNNRLKFLDSRMFEKTVMLKYLNISNNQLAHYDIDLGQMHLSLFSLQGNELRSIPQNSRTALDQMNNKFPAEINLSNNSLLCTCENLNFLNWMFFSAKLKFQDLDRYICRDELNRVKSLDRSLVLAKKNECKSYTGLTFGLGCTIIFFLSVTVVGLVYRYRWKIKYLYYAARDRYSTRHLNNDGRHFTYDAFISFANEDLDFVDQLMTNLEGQGTRLCVHHRDFRLGEPIGSNIVKAVQNSKHTVVILSENFLASDWCRYEFEMARMESVYSSRNVLLVVKIEDVRSAVVPRELLYMMNSESFLEYPDNAEDQTTFWLNLQQAIEGE